MTTALSQRSPRLLLVLALELITVVTASGSCGPACKGSCFDGLCMEEAVPELGSEGLGLDASDHSLDAARAQLFAAEAAAVAPPSLIDLPRPSANLLGIESKFSNQDLSSLFKSRILRSGTESQLQELAQQQLPLPQLQAEQHTPQRWTHLERGPAVSELDMVRTREAELRAENDAFKHELNMWKRVGGRVEAREAFALNELSQRSIQRTQAPAPPQSITSVAAASPLGLPARVHWLMWQMVVSLPVLVLLLAFIFVAWNGSSLVKVFRYPFHNCYKLKESDVGTGEEVARMLPPPATEDAPAAAAAKAAAVGSVPGGVEFALCRALGIQKDKPWPLVDGFLRYAGLMPCKVEVAEIHVGNLLAGKDFCIVLRDGQGSEHRTQSVQQSDGSFLKFGEIFTLDVRKSDQPVTLSVIDANGECARLEIPARNLVSLAQRRHERYFRSDLSTPRPQPGNPPYAAMRFRDVTHCASA